MSEILSVKITQAHLDAYEKYERSFSLKREYGVEDYEWLKLVWEYAMSSNKLRDDFRLRITRSFITVLEKMDIKVPKRDPHLDNWSDFQEP